MLPGGSGASQAGSTGDGATRPMPTRTSSAPNLRAVATFWTDAPSRTPSQFTAVRASTLTAAVSWGRVTDHVTPGSFTERSSTPDPSEGTKAPRYSPNPTAIAATPPVMMTRKEVQPKRNPHSGPYASFRNWYCPPALGNIAPSSP